MPLTIKVPGQEYFNNVTQEFYYTEDTVLTLEHSLISISKWEAKWHIPYLETKEKTNEQMYDYIRCMSIKGEISDEVLYSMNADNMKAITAYIENPMTATVIKRTTKGGGSHNQFTTSELIYSWMVGYQIPVEFEKWHLNRLLTLIDILNEQNKEQKKMTPSEIAARNRALNAKNRAKYRSRG